jgi:hypothetical protein
MFSHLGRDLRQAIRMIARTPMLAIVVIASLGVGIGVNTVVFAWIQARLFHPLPAVAGSAALELIEPRTDPGGYPGASWREYQDLRDRLGTVHDMLAFRMAPL